MKIQTNTLKPTHFSGQKDTKVTDFKSVIDEFTQRFEREVPEHGAFQEVSLSSDATGSDETFKSFKLIANPDLNKRDNDLKKRFLSIEVQSPEGKRFRTTIMQDGSKEELLAYLKSDAMAGLLEAKINKLGNLFD